ncbi:iron complex outermembrane recepter protein [Sphingomonas laterariae]|uniref:Iron complex outermembrane recepter protein n=1 Tax=Edaphosphingomonas laterariae TaxID=861865 RepID=A0A239F8W4_9SPHN|nr:TonB-dependent receptor [Sphingomonas laterariae]SNS52602.1 iron complex outermembrane recepter protein [Sphingomonas laterariae]
MSVSFHALGRASLFAVATSFAAPAFAEMAAPDTIIVTAAVETARDRVARTAGGSDVVAAAEFQDRLAVSLRDALAFSPGIYTQPRFGQEVRISVRGSGISRGFHMRGLMLFQDGVPINLADNNGDFQELDPQIFQHIEVFRGANALRLGSSTLGGGIDAVTPTGRTARGVEVRADGGSFATLRGKVAAGFTDGRGDGWFALTGDRSDGDRDHAKRSAIRFNGNIGLQLSDRIETRFYASLNHIDQELPGALTMAQALTDPGQANAGSVAGDQARDIESLRLQNRTTVDLGTATLSAGLFFNAKQLIHPIFQLIDQKSEDRGLFARVDWAGDLGTLPVEASLGTTARFGTVDARQFLNLAGKRGAQTADARQTAQTIDSYGEVRVAPVDHLWLIAGGVYTHGERRIDNRLAPQRSGRASFDPFAPKFGILWQPRADVQVYANYSRSVELPGFSELSQTPATGLPGFVDVDAQRAWTFEMGTRGRVGIAQWDVSLYRADITGEMLQFTVSQDIPAATFNADRTRHQGIEAALTLDLAPWARLRQSYQLNDFRFRNDAVYGDNRLPVVAKHLYRASLRLGTDRISVTPNIEWMPDGAWADYVNATRTRGYALLGLGAEAAVRDDVTLFLDARNLTGKKAIGDISAVVRATDASAIYYPVERRAVYGGVRARF